MEESMIISILVNPQSSFSSNWLCVVCVLFFGGKNCWDAEKKKKNNWLCHLNNINKSNDQSSHSLRPLIKQMMRRQIGIGCNICFIKQMRCNIKCNHKKQSSFKRISIKIFIIYCTSDVLDHHDSIECNNNDKHSSVVIYIDLVLLHMWNNYAPSVLNNIEYVIFGLWNHLLFHVEYFQWNNWYLNGTCGVE